MRNAEVMDQLRAARPAALGASDTTRAWRAIVTAPGDPRLRSSEEASPSRGVRIRRVVSGAYGRRVSVIAAVGLLAFGAAATAGVLGVEALLPTAPAPTLFRENPQFWNQDNHDHPPPDGLIQSSIRKAETLSIARVGSIQYWVARTRGGGSCEAFRLPDGTWAGTNRTENLKYNVGGLVPGCHQPNSGGYDGGGFYIDTNTFGPSPNGGPRAARDFTFVVSGTVSVKGAVRVRDTQTGRTTPIVDGEFFAIERPAGNWRHWTFQALDSTGKVLSTSRT